MAGIHPLRGSLCAALALASCGSPPAQAEPWQVFDQPGGYKVARGGTGGGSGLVQGIGLTCERNVPMIALSLARAPARNPALLSLSNGKVTGKLGVVRNGASNVWAGPLRDPRVLAMLARAGSVEVAVDGMRYGTVSLAGAADAMRGALGGCWVGTAVGAQGAPAPGAGGAGGALRPAGVGVAPLPIKDPATGQPRFPVKLGTYVETGKSCAKIGNGVEAEQIDVSGAPSLGIITELRSIREVSPGAYTGRVYWSSGGDAEETYSLRVQDSEHFSWAVQPNKAVQYSYCPPETVPENARVWLKSDYRSVQSLPIVAGYYQIWASDATPPKPTCEEYCGYMLITERGISLATTSAYAEPKGKIDRQAIVSPSITQDAPRHYFAKGKADYPSFGFTMDGAGGFTIDPDGEGSTVHVRRVDPAKIPAAKMPRF